VLSGSPRRGWFGRLVRLRWPRVARWSVYLALALYTFLWTNYYPPRHLAWLGVCAYLTGPTYTPIIPHVMVVEEAGTTRFVPYYSDEGARIQRARRPGEVVRGSLMTHPWPRSEGLLAPVHETFHVKLYVQDDPYGGGPLLRPAEVAALRPLYADFIEKEWNGPYSPTYLRFFREGDGTRSIVHPGWLAHDALIAVLLAATLASTVRHGARQRRAGRYRKRRRLLAGGSCPSCRYTISTLRDRGVANCPECGRVLRA